jgi:hypothetical protein
MGRYIFRTYIITTAVLAVVMILCLSWMSRDSAAQPNDATGNQILTVEQCINDNTDAAIKPPDKKVLVKAGIIEEQLRAYPKIILR